MNMIGFLGIKKNYSKRKTIIIGDAKLIRKFMEMNRSNIEDIFEIVGILTLNRDEVGSKLYGIEIIGIHEDIRDKLRRFNLQDIIILISDNERLEDFKKLIHLCENVGIRIHILFNIFSDLTKKTQIKRLSNYYILSGFPANYSGWAFFIKRTIDIIGSIVGIIVFLPVMIFAAIGIWLSDGRPVFYEWNVIGKNKTPIKSWKFRTMVRNADDLKNDLIKLNEMKGPVFKLAKDPRVLPFGRFLRKYSFDELPQLFSVLKGDLSLVGPRPPLVSEVEKYEDWHWRRLCVKPGLTCLWQISGRNKINNFDDWVRLDLKYIDNWSPWLDIKIIIKTLLTMISGTGH